MRGVDLDAKIRNVSRSLGIEVFLIRETDNSPLQFVARDPDLGPVACIVERPSDPERYLRKFRESVYQQRGRLLFERTGGVCALCGDKIKGGYEVDHIASRGKHGRSDVITNLRVVHPSLTHACHRERHGSK